MENFPSFFPWTHPTLILAYLHIMLIYDMHLNEQSFQFVCFIKNNIFANFMTVIGVRKKVRTEKGSNS